MVVYLNGQFVPASEATVSVFDRGFLYGDGLFETIRVASGLPCLWERHVQRLASGSLSLRIPLPLPPPELRSIVAELLQRNQLVDAVVRLTLTRGSGPRGYSIRGAHHPTLVVAAFPAQPIGTPPPKPWRLHTASVRLPVGDPLSAFKTTSKLTHILARAEAEDAGADEALILNTRDHIAEAAAANLFWFENETVLTPALQAGALAGVTRGFLMDVLRAEGWTVHEIESPSSALLQATGIFLTVSSWGLVEASHLDGRELARDPRFQSLSQLYQKRLTQCS